MEHLNNLRTAWLEGPSRRLAEWRQFRKNLDTTELESACKSTAVWWNSAPLCSISLDPESTELWPDAWELLHQGDVCKFSAALGMAYTIYYADSDVNNIIMRVYDHSKEDIYFATLINNTWLLNHTNCDIVLWTDVRNNLTIEEQWQTDDIVGIVKHKPE